VDALITPLNNAGALAEAFEQLTHDESLRNGLAAAGAKTVQDRFSKKVITGEYLDLYEKLLAKQ